MKLNELIFLDVYVIIGLKANRNAKNNVDNDAVGDDNDNDDNDDRDACNSIQNVQWSSFECQIPVTKG